MKTKIRIKVMLITIITVIQTLQAADDETFETSTNQGYVQNSVLPSSIAPNLSEISNPTYKTLENTVTFTDTRTDGTLPPLPLNRPDDEALEKMTLIPHLAMSQNLPLPIATGSDDITIHPSEDLLPNSVPSPTEEFALLDIMCEMETHYPTACDAWGVVPHKNTYIKVNPETRNQLAKAFKRHSWSHNHEYQQNSPCIDIIAVKRKNIDVLAPVLIMSKLDILHSERIWQHGDERISSPIQRYVNQTVRRLPPAIMVTLDNPLRFFNPLEGYMMFFRAQNLTPPWESTGDSFRYEWYYRLQVPSQANEKGSQSCLVLED